MRNRLVVLTAAAALYDPAGNLVNRFSTIWRREPSGDWKVVFDRGEPVCSCDPTGQ